MKTEISRKPVGLQCTTTRRPTCRGVMMRIELSRLEEGLGHEGFECSVCRRRVKYVPKESK